MKIKTAVVVAAAALCVGLPFDAWAQAPAPAPRPTTPGAPSKPSHSSASKTPSHNTTPPQTAAGFWAQVGNDGKTGGWFFFTEHDGVFEGRLVKMFKQPGETHLIDNCEKCEGDQKDAPMLGLTIVKGMKRDGYKYEEGSILDPRDGSVYHAQMEMSPDGQKLAVRGYLGIPLLGQTQTWQRLPDDAIAPADVPPESHGPNATSQ
jgi:uncharacterized protein (DUF2147 family)